MALPLIVLLLNGMASVDHAGWDTARTRSFSDGVSQANITGTEELLLAHTIGSDADRGHITGWWCASSHDHLILRFYVDGETVASVAFDVVTATGAVFGAPQKPVDVFSAEVFGKGGASGAFWGSIPVPFEKSIRVTWQAPQSAVGTGLAWIWCRGVEGMQLKLPGLPGLPPSARLVTQQPASGDAHAALSYIDLVSVPPKHTGIVLAVVLGMESANLNMLEGCVHTWADYGTDWSDANLLATGTEDYFLSADFNGGPFANARSGALFVDGPPSSTSARVAAYRVHGAYDPLVFSNGFRMVWRVGDETHSPSGLKCVCRPGRETTGCVPTFSPQVTNVTALSFVYTWPSVPAIVPLRTDDESLFDVPHQIWASSFGTTANGETDDTAALQAAINDCRANNRTLHISDGRYKISRPLLWSDWPGISVKGETAGAGGYNNAAPATLAIVAAHSLRGLVANDFTRSMYGVVEGIAFQNQGENTAYRPSVQVLIARSASGDGSELTIRRCNFGAGSTASVVIHMSEVITFEACRWSPSLDAPGLVITYRADREPWNVKPPSGLPLTSSVSMTVHRLFGGSISGGFAPGIVLDNMDARDANGNLAQAGDLLISGTYFWSVGQTFSAIELRGRWTNVIADAVRHECHYFVPPENQMETFEVNAGFVSNTSIRGRRVGKAGPGVATPFLRMGAGSILKHFRIHSYSDGDEASPIVAGVDSSLHAGSIIGHPEIILTGDKSSMKQVEIRSDEPLKLSVGGDVTDCTVRTNSVAIPAHVSINVSGTMSIDDGQGGVLLHSSAVAPKEYQNFVIGRSGMYSAAFGAELLLLHCAVVPRAASSCAEVSAHSGTSNVGGGSLTWSCAKLSCAITGHADGSVQQLEIRKVA